MRKIRNKNTPRVFQKTFHVHVMVISLTFHLLSSYFQEQFKIVRSFSFYKRTTCFEYLPCKIEKRHQGLLSFQSKVLQYKYKKKCVKILFRSYSSFLLERSNEEQYVTSQQTFFKEDMYPWICAPLTMHNISCFCFVRFVQITFEMKISLTKNISELLTKSK